MNRVLHIAAALSAVAASPTLAQTAAGPAREPVQTYSLTVTAADLQVMSRHLARGPYEDVAPLFAKLQGQIRAQNERSSAKSETPAAPPSETK